FVNLALVPEFGASYSVPAQLGYVAAAELILLGSPFDAKRALELGFVTRVVPDSAVLALARETAEKLAQKPAGALVASKKLLKRSFREQLTAAAKAEGQEFASRVRSAEAKEAFAAFFDKHRLETRCRAQPPLRQRSRTSCTRKRTGSPMGRSTAPRC